MIVIDSTRFEGRFTIAPPLEAAKRNKLKGYLRRAEARRDRGSPGPTPATSSPTLAPTTAPAAAPASIAVTIAWPDLRTTSAHRRPQYVSQGTQSLTIAVAGQTLTENNPTLSGSPLATQTYTILLAAGPQQAFTISLFDQTNGAGDLLGRSTTMQDVLSGVANTLLITVDGELFKIAIVPVANPYLETGKTGAVYTLVGPLAQTFAVVPQDAKGYTIVAPGKIPPITFTSPSGSGVVVAPVSGMTNLFTVTAPAPTTAVTLTAAGVELDQRPVTATTTAQALAALFVTDPVAHTLSAFDETGTPIAFAAGAFPNLVDTRNCGPRGLTYVPGNAAGGPRLFVTRCSAPQGNNVGNLGTYDLLGNEIQPATPFTPSLPQFVTYDPAGPGELLVTDGGGPGNNPATVEIYGRDGTLVSSNAGPHPRAFEQANSPGQIAFDPVLKTPDYVITDGSGYVERYTNDGTFVSKTAAGFTPIGITYDTNKKLYYVATYASVLPGGAPADERATVFAYDATLVQQTTGTANAVAFMNINRATGVLFDPYLNVLYVSDYAGHQVFAFNEDGSAATTLTTAITSVVNPEGLTLAP